MVYQRRRCWATINPALEQRLMNTTAPASTIYMDSLLVQCWVWATTYVYTENDPNPGQRIGHWTSVEQASPGDMHTLICVTQKTQALKQCWHMVSQRFVASPTLHRHCDGAFCSLVWQRIGLWFVNSLSLRWFNVGSSSSTMAQHLTNVGPTSGTAIPETRHRYWLGAGKVATGEQRGLCLMKNIGTTFA